MGELIGQEQAAGRLASQKSGRPNKSDTGGRLILKDIGLNEQDSHRAQLVATHPELIPVAVEQAVKQKDPSGEKIIRR